jgi:hypothetical protein
MKDWQLVMNDWKPFTLKEEGAYRKDAVAVLERPICIHSEDETPHSSDCPRCQELWTAQERSRWCATLDQERDRSARFELLTGTDVGWDDLAEAAGLDRNDWEWWQLRDAVSDLKIECDAARLIHREADGLRKEAYDRIDALNARIKELEIDLHDAIIRANEAETRADCSEVMVLPVEEGIPGEVDMFSDGHSHHYVPTSLYEEALARIEKMGEEAYHAGVERDLLED